MTNAQESPPFRAPSGAGQASSSAMPLAQQAPSALPDAKRALPVVLNSPCFVHSYLDNGLDNYRKDHSYFDENHSFQSLVAPGMSAGWNGGIHGADAKRKPTADYNSPKPPAASVASSSATSDSASQSPGVASGSNIRKGRRASARPHRGMQGAVEPDSDDHHDEDDASGSASSSGSTTTSPEDSYDSAEEEETRVRSLTRQLAETAVGVREMSKQLGRARVKSTIQSVMIITKARDNHLIKLTREMAIWLMVTPRNGRQSGLTVYVDSQLRQSKRFDAEGIRRDYPQIVTRAPSNGHSNRSSESGVGGGSGVADERGSESSASASFESIKSFAPTSPGVSRTNGGSQLREESLLRYWTSDMCSRSPHLFDFVVTLGGDGTVLFCSWLFQRIVPPVMPFALGSLGFLTNFDFKNYKSVLQSALDTGIRVNLRMRFTATVYRSTLSSSTKINEKRRRAIKSGKTGEIIMKNLREHGWESIETPLPRHGDLRGQPVDKSEKALEQEREPIEAESSKHKKDKEIMCFSTRPVETFEVLNDLVVDRGPSPYVSLLEVFGDEHHLTTAQADGLCISTPTGSTAYSLSAGGSLVHPEIPAILISPICPHTLSFRPMLLPDSMELRIAVPYNSRSTAWASFDGRGRVELKQGDHIKVTASRYPFPTVCADNQSKDWFESISRTLKWNERERQKSFVVVEEGDEENNKGSDTERMRKPSSKKSGHGGRAKKADKQAWQAKKHKEPVQEDQDNDDDDDDDDQGDDDDDEDEDPEEHFDIEDTSQAATRTNSPDHSKPGGIPRRSSTGSGLSRRHHHHHHHHHDANGHRSRSQASSSTSSLNSGSSPGLSLFGLTPLTAADGNNGSGEHRNATESNWSASLSGYSSGPSPSAQSRVSFDVPTSKSSATSTEGSDAHGSTTYQHGVVKPSNRSLLESPDRFGLAGPPAPPQSLSERHLATADFRLDEPQENETNSTDLHLHQDRPSAREGATGSKSQTDSQPSQSPAPISSKDLHSSIVQVAERKSKLAHGTNKLYRKLKGRSSSLPATGGSGSNDSSDGFLDGFELSKIDSRKASGAAIVVYGQDESDSDSTAEGQ